MSFPWDFGWKKLPWVFPDFQREKKIPCSPCWWTPWKLSNRYSENANLNSKFSVALCIAIWKSYAKNKENQFFNFLFITIFLLIRISTCKFVWCFAMLLKSFMQKMKKNLSMKFKVMQTFLTNAPRNLWDAYIPAGLKGLRKHSYIPSFS